MTTDTPTAGAPYEASFADLGLHEDLVTALAAAGITSPFPIQELTLPMGLGGADIIGQARTGTGKTLAFGLPMLQRVDPDDSHTQALVIVPTRELCLQVADDLETAGQHKSVHVVAAYGGRPIEPQINAIQAGAPVVVGTPGRLLDLSARGALDLSTVSGVVLDEADEMLDLGFLPDVEQLIEATASPRQTLLFSATMPSAVVGLARRYMHKPTFLRADVEEPDVSTKTRQYFFSCHKLDKPAVMARILSTPGRGLTLGFVRTKRMADVLAKDLSDRGIAAAPIHSDLRQEARERTLNKFRKGTIDTLIATEVAARGLDIDDVTHVINYDCPDDEKMYLHRIGRTGRAGSSGVAITLAMWNEAARLEMIKRALDITDETHEVFSTSPILDELFDLPPAQRKTRAPSNGSKASSRSKKSSAKTPSQKKSPEPSTPPPAGRSRRRARRDAANGVDAARERLPSAHAPQASGSDDNESTPRTRTRTRKRTRTRSGSPVGETTTNGQTDTKAAKDAAAGGEPATDAAASPGSPDTKKTKDERSAPGDSRRNNRRRGGSRRKGKRRDADKQRNVGHRRTPSLDSDALRGGGQPRLRRPLEVEHLP